MTKDQESEWNARRALRHKTMTYEAALRAVQSGIATLMQFNGRFATPKHLRVGNVLSKVDQSALASLLISKGIFTEEEYVEAIRIATIEEVQFLEARLAKHLGHVPVLM
jgi:hypothetical protein